MGKWLAALFAACCTVEIVAKCEVELVARGLVAQTTAGCRAPLRPSGSQGTGGLWHDGDSGERAQLSSGPTEDTYHCEEIGWQASQDRCRERTATEAVEEVRRRDQEIFCEAEEELRGRYCSTRPGGSRHPGSRAHGICPGQGDCDKGCRPSTSLGGYGSRCCMGIALEASGRAALGCIFPPGSSRCRSVGIGWCCLCLPWCRRCAPTQRGECSTGWEREWSPAHGAFRRSVTHRYIQPRTYRGRAPDPAEVLGQPWAWCSSYLSYPGLPECSTTSAPSASRGQRRYRILGYFPGPWISSFRTLPTYLAFAYPATETGRCQRPGTYKVRQWRCCWSSPYQSSCQGSHQDFAIEARSNWRPSPSQARIEARCHERPGHTAFPTASPSCGRPRSRHTGYRRASRSARRLKLCGRRPGRATIDLPGIRENGVRGSPHSSSRNRLHGPSRLCRLVGQRESSAWFKLVSPLHPVGQCYPPGALARDFRGAIETVVCTVRSISDASRELPFLFWSSPGFPSDFVGLSELVPLARVRAAWGPLFCSCLPVSKIVLSSPSQAFFMLSRSAPNTCIGGSGTRAFDTHVPVSFPMYTWQCCLPLLAHSPVATSSSAIFQTPWTMEPVWIGPCHVDLDFFLPASSHVFDAFLCSSGLSLLAPFGTNPLSIDSFSKQVVGRAHNTCIGCSGTGACHHLARCCSFPGMPVAPLLTPEFAGLRSLLLQALLLACSWGVPLTRSCAILVMLALCRLLLHPLRLSRSSPGKTIKFPFLGNYGRVICSLGKVASTTPVLDWS